MNDWQASMEEHNRQMSLLAEKYIGKKEMDRGLAMSDLWFKKQWYWNRLRDLAFQAGKNNQRLRRCKLDSPSWKRYEKAEQECLMLADNLALDLMAL